MTINEKNDQQGATNIAESIEHQSQASSKRIDREIVTIDDGLRGYFCCSFPHGEFSIIPLLLVTVAFFLTVSCHKWCEFAERDSLIDINDGIQYTYNATTVGLWSFQGSGIYRGPQSSSALASIIGGVCLISLWLSACVGMPQFCWRIVAFSLLLCCVFEGLTLLVFKSNICNEVEYMNMKNKATCSLAWGSKVAIAATVFWFFGSVSTCFMPEAEPTGSIVIAKTTTTTERIDPDGTRCIVTETVSTHV